MNKKQFKTCTGKVILIDISDKPHNKGFKHGDRIIENNIKEKGVFIGVAPSRHSETTLWFLLDCDNGVSYSEPFKKGNLSIIETCKNDDDRHILSNNCKKRY